MKRPMPALVRRTALILLAVCSSTVALAASARKQSVTEPVDFSSQIRPLISSKCFSCHGPDESSRKAKLRLDLRDEAIKDHKGTRAIVPGEAASSELVRRITATDPDDIMPPPKTGRTLSAVEIDLLKRWIQQGAPYSPHWAFVKPERGTTPAVRMKSWPRNAIDYFVLAKLERNGL